MSAEKQPPAVEAEGVSFTYEEGTVALRDVAFRVESGEFVALLASNGSGKSTLIKALVKLLVPQQGAIRINGRDLKGYSAKELYQQVGLVLQDPNDQLFAPTVNDDVAFGPRNLGLGEAVVEDRVTTALSWVGAEALRERAIHHLSFGEKKRVCLAGVLAMQPSILMLDEPTAGLDPAGEAQMLHLLNRLNRERGITIILATHSVDLLPLFADRIYVLSRGSVLMEGTPAVIFTNHDMVAHASLRLPYISRLIHELRHFDGVPIEGLPLTVGEARQRLVELIPPDLIVRTITEKRP